MTRDEFARLVGGVLSHVTLTRNLPGIRENGLMSAASLLARHGSTIEIQTPRNHAASLHEGAQEVMLNHQKPLLAGRHRVADFLEGHSLRSWAAQLDRRIFFWPRTHRREFTSSLTDRGAIAVLQCDARRLFDLAADRLDLAPINTGSAMRRAAYRGDWIYVPATQSLEQFENNRRIRGLSRRPDRVVEVSLRRDLSADETARLFDIHF
ncbi:MAG: hypothetical protein AAF582_15675 [Pseudomonadota bacterium]